MFITLCFILCLSAVALVVEDEPPRQGRGSTGIAYTPIPEHLIGALLDDVEMDGLTMEHASVFAQQRVASLKPAKQQTVRSGKIDLPMQACDGASVCPSATVEHRSAIALQQQALAEVQQQQGLAAEMHQALVASPKSYDYVPVPDELVDALLADVDMDEALLADASVLGRQRSARIDRKGNGPGAHDANLASSATMGLDMPGVASSVSHELADALLADIAEDGLAFDDVSVLGFQIAATVTPRHKRQETALTDERGSVEHQSVEEVGTTPLQPAASSIVLSVEEFVEWGSDDDEAAAAAEADAASEAAVEAGPTVTSVGPMSEWGTEVLVNSTALSDLTVVEGSRQGLRTDKFDRPDSSERARSIVRRTDKLDRPHSHHRGHGQWLQDLVAGYHDTLLPLGFLVLICLTFLRLLVAQVRKLSDVLQNEGGKK